MFHVPVEFLKGDQFCDGHSANFCKVAIGQVEPDDGGSVADSHTQHLRAVVVDRALAEAEVLQGSRL